MNFFQRISFWVASLLFLTLFIWLFRPVLLPFVSGVAIAYLLNPLVLRLCDLKLSRTLAALILLVTFILLSLGLIIFISPRIYQELLQLAQAMPEYIDAAGEKIRPIMRILQIEISGESINQNLRDLLKNNISGALNISSSLVSQILSSGRALIDFLVFLFLTPLVSFILLRDWPLLADWFKEILPKSQKKNVLDLASKIDQKIAGFFRGQLIVAAMLGVIYAVLLSIVGLQYGFLIGVVSGVLSIIPLFGSIVGMVIGVGTAYLQNGSLLFVVLVGGIFVIGQILEGNFITPRIMSGSVGLHPLWILFSLMAGNALLGIMGMLLAIPVAASAGVMLNYFIEQYKNSEYYND